MSDCPKSVLAIDITCLAIGFTLIELNLHQIFGLDYTDFTLLVVLVLHESRARTIVRHRERFGSERFSMENASSQECVDHHNRYSNCPQHHSYDSLQSIARKPHQVHVVLLWIFHGFDLASHHDCLYIHHSGSFTHPEETLPEQQSSSSEFEWNSCETQPHHCGVCCMQWCSGNCILHWIIYAVMVHTKLHCSAQRSC